MVMSQSYTKSCMFCKQEIVISDRTSGNWLSYDLNGYTIVRIATQGPSR